MMILSDGKAIDFVQLLWISLGSNFYSMLK